jgi:hypothetical protein
MSGHRKTLRGNARPQVAEELQRNSQRQRILSPTTTWPPSRTATRGPAASLLTGTNAERHGLLPEQVVGKRISEVVGEQAWSTYERYFRECVARQPKPQSEPR